MTDSLVGTRRQIAQDFAQSFEFPLARHEQEDMPQVAQSRDRDDEHGEFAVKPPVNTSRSNCDAT